MWVLGQTTHLALGEGERSGGKKKKEELGGGHGNRHLIGGEKGVLIPFKPYLGGDGKKEI